MALDLTSDLETIFNTDELAQTATYIRQGYASAQVPVIFGNEYVVAQGPGEQGIGTSAPTALCKTADVPAAAEGDTLTIDGMTYRILEVQPDGTGITLLILSKDRT
ncbi:MAG TPA: hypothetical protein VJO14_05935 [Bacteroidota bacterium]|nr:hypothetical protein [Bacteroidota bacterium]